jgi:hypothetical protein
VRLWRVLYYDETADQTEPGGVFYIPPQGAGRIDNPLLYSTLYLGDSAAGVCAEVFYRGRYRLAWSAAMLRPLPSGLRRVLVWYDLADDTAICNLNDPGELFHRNLPPSRVITRDYRVTHRWAGDIYHERRYVGVRWWSYCDARWATLALWARDAFDNHGVEELSLDHAAIKEAAAALDVRIQAA